MEIKTQNNELKQFLELFGISTDPIIGIDIGSSAVKIIELGKQNDRYVIQNFAIEPLNVGDVVEKNIKNICKEEYYKLCEKDNRLSTEPDIIFKGQFKGWIDYLGIQKDYYTFEICKIKVNEYITKYPEIKTNYLELSLISSELSKIDKLFPPDGLWVEYYNIKDLRDIITIKSTKKKSGVII